MVHIYHALDDATLAAMEPLEVLGSQRDAFDIPPEITYLNCASLAPQLRSVTRAGIEAVRDGAAPWHRSSASFFEGPERVRALAARLMNVHADQVAVVPSVSYGIALAAANVSVERGQSIVILADQFPSNVYAWRALARARGAQLRTVQRPPTQSWTGAVLDAIDSSTAVVAVPNCHWTDGALVDLVPVAQAARSVGAALVVDASQSFGAYPLDVGAIRPDFLVSVGYKWLLGPYTLGYLYVAPERIAGGRPLELSWMGREGAEDFARLIDYTDELRAGARRFDMGESSHFTCLPMAVAGLEQILQWGVGRIQRSLTPLTRMLEVGARELGGEVLTESERVGHLIGIRLPGVRREIVADTLERARIYVSIRGSNIRVAPHLYNDPADVERFLSALKKIIEEA
jgi:selenocysteine lyase/cysteine desulfurase